jgi:hypothetical protein
MARDLIPAPSPAGRPQPEGTPRLVELPPEPTVDQLEPTEPPPPRRLAPSRFRNRFGFLTGGLIGVVVAAVALLAIGLSGNNGTPTGEGLAKNWSKWHPGDAGLPDGSAEIADHVGKEYKLGDGSQLTMVRGGPVQTLDPNVKVALRPVGGEIHTFGTDHGVLYTLNGLGPAGSVQGGKASPQRAQLLRREALELALYSFRYLKDVDMVVTLLPTILPGAKTKAGKTTSEPEQQAVFYRPGDLKAQLQVPLGVSVPAKTPRPETMGGDDGKKVDVLTLDNLFVASFMHAQTGEPYLVLDRAS